MRLALLLILLTAGCVSFPGFLSAFQLFPTKSFVAVEDLSIQIQPAPDTVIEGKTTTLFFDIENNGNTTISNIRIRPTDLCVFTGFTADLVIPSLRAEDKRNDERKITASSVDLRRDCELRFETTYDSEAFLRSDIAVVSEDELARINRQNAAPDLRIFEFSTDTPIKIDISYSKPMPMPTSTDFFVYLKLVDQGGFGARDVTPADFTVEYPSALVDLVSCDDLTPASGSVLQLRTNQKFFKGETKTFTCKFHTKQQSGAFISNVGQFKANLKYKYTLRQNVAVAVVPE